MKVSSAFSGAADNGANLQAFETHLRGALDAETCAYWDRKVGLLQRKRITRKCSRVICIATA